MTARTYTRTGYKLAPYTLAEAVTTSLTECVATYDDGALERLERRLTAQAEAIGQLASLVVALTPEGMRAQADAALVEILSHQFKEVEA